MQELLRDGNFVMFTLDWHLVNPVVFKATVYQVTGWNMDNSVRDTEMRLKAEIKWDGCSHLFIGNEDMDEKGYLHICGEQDWKNHILMLQALLDFAKSKLKSWDYGS